MEVGIARICATLSFQSSYYSGPFRAYIFKTIKWTIQIYYVIENKSILMSINALLASKMSHFKEKDHNKSFYQLCRHMEPNYHQYEFDLRLYLTHLDLYGPLYL